MMKQVIILLSLLLGSFAIKAQDKAVVLHSQAPEILMQQPDGKMLKLSSLRGSLVLVDFWATWCSPCIEEQPALKALYDKHSSEVKEGKFQILGVSLDSKKENWEKGIKTLQITWPQVSDLSFWKSQAAKDYGIEGLPFNVVVDAAGKIIAINLHGKALEDFINDHLSK
jgi:thiol-disulfide isomerase/thioredoxin